MPERSLPSRSLVGWILLPLLSYLLAHVVLVRPAQRQLTFAQQALLDAEREELAAEVALTRAERTRTRLAREVADLEDTTERMRRAELAAEAQLSSLRGSVRNEFVLPGASRDAANAAST